MGYLYGRDAGMNDFVICNSEEKSVKGNKACICGMSVREQALC